VGAIRPEAGIPRSQRKIVMLRDKLFDQMRRRYIREGKSVEEAAALAVALVRGTKFMRA
jgi:hypothetical protein